jgi:hypothetical protein
MLEIVPACVDHLVRLQGAGAVCWTSAHLAYAWTALDAGEPVCAWGLTPLWPGVGMLWCAEGPLLAGHRQRWQIARAMWRHWQQYRGEFRYVEACALETRPDSQNLLMYLGFRLVCRKPGYGMNGETLLEYQWVQTSAHERERRRRQLCLCH